MSAGGHRSKTCWNWLRPATSPCAGRVEPGSATAASPDSWRNDRLSAGAGRCTGRGQCADLLLTTRGRHRDRSLTVSTARHQEMIDMRSDITAGAIFPDYEL